MSKCTQLSAAPLRQVFVLCLVAAAASAARSSPGSTEHRLRRVDLSADGTAIHALAVVGAPHLTTTVRLPDSFRAGNVACGGDCVDAQALGPGKTNNLGANWVLDLRPQERTLHLWPAALPSADNPPSAFRSNIYVGLDGGDVLNVALSLVDPAHGGEQADAVVDVVLQDRLAYSSRLEREKEAVLRRTQQQAKQILQAHMQKQLSGTTRCRQVRWSLPHRHEKTVVRLKQICSTGGTESLRWVVFSIENRASVPLAIGALRLVPEHDELTHLPDYQDLGASTTAQVLAPGAATLGVAMVELHGAQLAGDGWTLWVEAREPRVDQVRVGHITF